jgi:hypothetical protein
MNVESVVDEPRPWTALVTSAARSWRPALAGALAGALFAVLVPPAIDAARELFHAASQDEAATRTALVWPTRELPREWRWSPPGVRVDHMFRRPR